MDGLDNSTVEERDIRRYFNRINALFCIKVLIVLEISFKISKTFIILGVLYKERHFTEKDSALVLFLSIYSVLCVAKSITFYFKNRSFFHISRIPEYEENPDIALVNNILEATMLFWYIVGFHCIQECTTCKISAPLIYYTTLITVIVGFISFIAPLLAIVLLLFLISYVRPKLQTMQYKQGIKLPNETRHCTICYDEYLEGTEIKLLPCGHHYHTDCIDEWISVRENCPLCKKNINILFDIVEGDDTVTV